MSARFRISYPSRVLLRPVEIMAALSAKPNRVKKTCLWALHCAMEDGPFFLNYLDAARLAQHLDIAIIAPSLGNGFFMDTAYEAQGEFLRELRENLPSILNISDKTEDNAVVGISMGGFGAIRWALEDGGILRGCRHIRGV